jgi:hypothetical protein
MIKITPEYLARNNSESGHQKALFLWASLNLYKYPELKWMLHIQNASANKAAKVMGVKAGVPDIFLPIENAVWSGLWIEMKRPKVDKQKAGIISDEQEEWIAFLRLRYLVIIAYSWEQARDYLIEYLGVR